MARDDETTQGDALASIAKEAPGALKLVGDLMERNSRDYVWNMEGLLEHEKAAHARTQARLDKALDRLALINERMNWLLGGEMWDDAS